MEEKRFGLSAHSSLKALPLVFMLVCSCSMPRIVVLEDPLSASEHNSLGVIYESKGDYGLAEQEYLKAAGRERSWPVPLFNLGNLRYARGDLEGAEHYYRRCLALDEGDTDAMNNLANVLHDLGRSREALELIQRAIAGESRPEYLDTYRKIAGSTAAPDWGDRPAVP
ncbi:MAG TPA: tetratricopeptide repeat protein [Deltaproteobacteria bacterium]|nr:tetratricopeptide repeat protein [Deltaproteobacteria bacterium]HQA72135.1 tetratricopeptide repeat protein [Deltaproteobacteria bacterium]